MMNLDELDAERKAFEAWSRANGYGGDLRRKLSCDEYVNLMTHGAWEAWKGRATLREKPDLSTDVLRETPDLSTSALIEAQAITGRQLMARLSAGEAFINAPTSVCDETDVVCSRGCGAGPCKAKK